MKTETKVLSAYTYLKNHYNKVIDNNNESLYYSYDVIQAMEDFYQFKLNEVTDDEMEDFADKSRVGGRYLLKEFIEHLKTKDQ